MRSRLSMLRVGIGSSRKIPQAGAPALLLKRRSKVFVYAGEGVDQAFCGIKV